MGELWSVYCEDFWQILQRYKYRLKTKARNKSHGEIFCGVKFYFYFAELYEVMKGQDP